MVWVGGGKAVGWLDSTEDGILCVGDLHSAELADIASSPLLAARDHQRAMKPPSVSIHACHSARYRGLKARVVCSGIMVAGVCSGVAAMHTHICIGITDGMGIQSDICTSNLSIHSGRCSGIMVADTCSGINSHRHLHWHVVNSPRQVQWHHVHRDVRCHHGNSIQTRAEAA